MLKTAQSVLRLPMFCAQHARCISFLHCHTRTLPKEWYRSRVSGHCCDSLRPSSCKKRVASSPTGPSVSMATGMNWNSFDSAVYLSIFSCSAWLATCPGPATAIRSGGWLWACQGSGHVKSQAKLWPRDQGIVVSPSGLLLSQWDCLAGSSRERISTESKLSRLITPLTAF